MKIVLVGCGNMGKLLLEHWEEECTVVQPSLAAKELFPKAHFVTHPDEIEEAPDVVVFAVKPQQLPKIIEDYRRFSPLFVSIVTGLSTEWFLEQLGKESPCIRVMPNVAIRKKESANMAFATSHVEEAHKQMAHKLFQPTGPLYWMEEEQWLDTLTPMVGSGPAFFFLLAETLIEAACKRGIDRKLASSTVRQALLGSALLVQEEEELEDLRQSVTSKGGVTEAALEVLLPALSPLIEEAMEKALQRNEELSS